ncbi:2,3-diaminopropionate biosynthesis protein SbnB [Paenibacillus cymbidii]|uniref:2,3-diaminopropionate biosynthesis protein SbnB n=1 Tax=Paenibacillus cymbidii TaxID=1639034 RepID=UPI001081B2A9|nr:2,3-diaminopropionate biosynthesis protein SbnB [Paenibacillus cymbidii]
MRYLNDRDLNAVGMPWGELADVIEAAAGSYAAGECAQPLKPYLQYGDPANRIIAMPAYVGRPVRAAGLKWIASFPANVASGLPRAHGVTVVNDPDTGIPQLLIAGGMPNAVRTTAVSAALLRKLLPSDGRKRQALVIGAGPIGSMHARMLAELFGDTIARIGVYDKRATLGEGTPLGGDERIVRCGEAEWREAYTGADVVVTCTVATDRYIELTPKRDALLLHVSLRDYLPGALAAVATFVVDDWNEVCRADTDIERLHLGGLLERGQALAFPALVSSDAARLQRLPRPLLFAPMGLAIFDVAIAAWYGKQAEQRGLGVLLEL